MAIPPVMVVDIFDPVRHFGFCRARGGQERVFFHVTTFVRLNQNDKAPPLPGEPVEIIVKDEPVAEGQSPKAAMVRRVSAPVEVLGRIRSFDVRTGWGFIEDEHARVCFLHRADMLDNRVPVIGDDVVFYEGVSGKGQRVRACGVRFME